MAPVKSEAASLARASSMSISGSSRSGAADQRLARLAGLRDDLDPFNDELAGRDFPNQSGWLGTYMYSNPSLESRCATWLRWRSPFASKIRKNSAKFRRARSQIGCWRI